MQTLEGLKEHQNIVRNAPPLVGKICEDRTISGEGDVLVYADFRMSHFSKCRFTGSIRFTGLSSCTFQECSFNFSRFYCCDFSYSKFIHCDMRRASFIECILNDVKSINSVLNLNCHDWLVALLYQEQVQNMKHYSERVMLEMDSLIGIIDRNRALCWDDFLNIDHPQKEWALTTLYNYFSKSGQLATFYEKLVETSYHFWKPKEQNENPRRDTKPD